MHLARARRVPILMTKDAQNRVAKPHTQTVAEEGDMITRRTAEEAARHLVDVVRAHPMRAANLLSRGTARVAFVARGQWSIDDFAVAIRYACEHDWITLPSPTVIRLTTVEAPSEGRSTTADPRDSVRDPTPESPKEAMPPGIA